MSRFYVTIPCSGAAIPLCVNGETLTLKPNERTEIPEHMLPALLSSDHTVDIDEVPDGEPVVDELDPSTAGASGGETAGGGAGVGAGAAADSLTVEPDSDKGVATHDGTATTGAATFELPEGFLDRTVEVIGPDLADKPLPFLEAAKAAETAGKARVTLLASIDAAIIAATPAA